MPFLRRPATRFSRPPGEGGSEALEAASRHPVQAVLLDIMMPELSGLEALGQLHERFPDLPVVILTAHPSSQNTITALKLGALDFIVKALQIDLWVVAVRRATHRFAELREKRELVGALEGRIRELEARLAAVSGTSEPRSSASPKTFGGSDAPSPGSISLPTPGSRAT